MNVFHKVTLQSLKKNKTRTLVTIIGIILSAAMICAVTTFVSSFQNFLIENTIYENGDWHGRFFHMNLEQMDKVDYSEEVDSSVVAQIQGYAFAEDCKNEYKPYLYVLGAGDNFNNTLPVRLTSGTYPKTKTEIILPEHLFSNGGVKRYSIGEEITLDLGDRTSDGAKLFQNQPYFMHDNVVDEKLDVKRTKTFTVVGFYERPSFEDVQAPGYTAITRYDEDIEENCEYEMFYKLKNINDSYTFFNSCIEKESFVGAVNSDLLMYSSVFKYSNFSTALASLAAIVIILIMFGSISLIYNAFSISVSERTKQFGLLSSIGATKKQLKKMVFYEAFVVSAIGIPLGILSGIGGIAVTLHFIGKKFMSMGFNVGMKISVSLFSVIIACVVALVTVLLSAWIPSRRAMKVSAIESIRQNNDIKINSKQVKTSKFTYKLFGLSGVLASKNFKRNKKKYRATVISLFMSIVLFVSAASFSNNLMKASAIGYDTRGYDLSYRGFSAATCDMSISSAFEKLSKADAVTKSTYVQSVGAYSELPAHSFTKEYLKSYWRNFETEDVSELETSGVNFGVFFVPENTFKEVLKANGLDEKVFMDPEKPQGVAYDRISTFDRREGKFITCNVFKAKEADIEIKYNKRVEGYYFAEDIVKDGQNFKRYVNWDDKDDEKLIPAEEAEGTYSLKMGAKLKERPYFVNSEISDTILIYPENFMRKLIPDELIDDNCDFFFISDNHVKSFESLKEILIENSLVTDRLDDYAKQAEDSRNMITIIQVFSYGFIVLISLIAAANVFNTISTNIILRRREFAMLKSVGMTSKDFNRMMNYECVFYGAKSLLFGLPVSIGISFLIYLSISNVVESGFELPWAAIGIAVLSVFAVVFATMLYSMRKIKKDNPIDALKNENL